MFFVEVLYLVDVEQNSASREDIVGRAEDLLYVRERRGGRVDAVERHIRALCDDLCGGGLSRAGRAEEDHIRKSACRDHSADNSALAEKVILTDYVVKALGAYGVRGSEAVHLSFLSKVLSQGGVVILEAACEIVDRFHNIGKE